MYCLNSLSFLPRQSRCFTNNALMLAKNHYDALGISPRATQSDIKGAYYKLSMVYHPDKNEGSDSAAKKFRDITEAYEILGNVRLRKLYDKGVVNIGVNTTTPTHQSPIDPTLRFYKSRETRTRPPTTGKTPIYDFDEWSKSHYGATFKKDMERKRNTQFQQMKATNDLQEIRTLNVLLAVSAFMGVIMYFSYGARNEDNIVVENNRIPKQISKVD